MKTFKNGKLQNKMELPLELKYKVASYLSVGHIEISMPHLLNSVNIWKMLFLRDFLLDNEIIPNKRNYFVVLRFM